MNVGNLVKLHIQLFSFSFFFYYCERNYVFLDDGLNILLEFSQLFYYLNWPSLEDKENSIITVQSINQSILHTH